MTYCTSISRPLLKKINEGKSLDEIGAELCGASVKNPRRKAIRLIRELLGEETLLEHATTLKYDTGMAEIGKLEKSPHTPLQKNETAPRRSTSTIYEIYSSRCGERTYGDFFAYRNQKCSPDYRK
jgi:hypothetical protein